MSIDTNKLRQAASSVRAFLKPEYGREIAAAADHIDAQADEIAALRQPWQPIETAPKDGTHVILTNGAAVSEGWWEHQEPYIRPERDAYGGIQDQAESDGYDDWLDVLGGMQPIPTHWMRLPAPPAALSGESNGTT